jgi:hypothetical protein
MLRPVSHPEAVPLLHSQARLLHERGGLRGAHPEQALPHRPLRVALGERPVAAACVVHGLEQRLDGVRAEKTQENNIVIEFNSII